jgi:transcriptional regulator with XRE-family HTH domain
MAKLTLSEALKKAILKSEMTQYQIAKEAGIDQGMITRFLSDERDLRLETASKIAEVVGAKLVVDAERTRSSRKNTK